MNPAEVGTSALLMCSVTVDAIVARGIGMLFLVKSTCTYFQELLVHSANYPNTMYLNSCTQSIVVCTLKKKVKVRKYPEKAGIPVICNKTWIHVTLFHHLLLP